MEEEDQIPSNSRVWIGWKNSPFSSLFYLWKDWNLIRWFVELVTGRWVWRRLNFQCLNQWNICGLMKKKQKQTPDNMLDKQRKNIPQDWNSGNLERVLVFENLWPAQGCEGECGRGFKLSVIWSFRLCWEK